MVISNSGLQIRKQRGRELNERILAALRVAQLILSPQHGAFSQIVNDLAAHALVERADLTEGSHGAE